MMDSVHPAKTELRGTDIQRVVLTSIRYRGDGYQVLCGAMVDKRTATRRIGPKRPDVPVRIVVPRDAANWRSIDTQMCLDALAGKPYIDINQRF